MTQNARSFTAGGIGAHGAWVALDRLRRARGERLEALGWGAIETPWREVCRTGGMRLRAYGEGRGAGPVLLLVPAPIKRASIWDLAPGRSVVQHALAAGCHIGLIEWTEPEGDVVRYGLEDYADRLLGAAVEVTARTHRTSRVLLAGHSLGGTFAAIFTALHPERVRGCVLLEAPLHFAPDAGALGSLVAAAPCGPEATSAALDVVPGSLLSALAVAADPSEFIGARWVDAMASAADPEAFGTHLRVLRWSLDELAMPAKLFEDVAGLLCRDDAFHRGSLTIAGRRVGPAQLDMPLLGVVDPDSVLVPPRSMIPFLERTAASWELRRHRETSAGVAFRHLGALIGRDAHRDLWPGILRWLSAVWSGRSAGSV